jgi:hypothetical protein
MDYGAIVRCDLFELDSVYVIHYVGKLDYACAVEPDDTEIDLIVVDIDLHLESAKVIIAAMEECTRTKRLVDYMDGGPQE